MHNRPELGTAYVSPVKLISMEGGNAYRHVARLWSTDGNAFMLTASAAGLTYPPGGWYEHCTVAGGLAYAVEITPGERLRCIEAGAEENNAPGPVDGSPATCRSCGRPIVWVKTEKGRNAPYDASGLSHFATCPQANDWRNRPARRK